MDIQCPKCGSKDFLLYKYRPETMKWVIRDGEIATGLVTIHYDPLSVAGCICDKCTHSWEIDNQDANRYINERDKK
jgi:hypothetical protein